MRSGIVTRVRYQLKHTRPCESRRCVSAGARAPTRVVVVDALRVRHDVVGAVGGVAGAERVGGIGPADLDEVDLVDVGVGVAPLGADERGAGVGLQVDDRVGAAGQQLGRPGRR